MGGMLPASVQKAFAIDPEPGTTFLDAEHVVLLMQENRSFDHCFGSLQGVRGFNDPRAIRLPGGNPVWLQTDARGRTFVPFRLNIRDTRATWMGGLPHSWEDMVDARNQGRYDAWLTAKAPGNKEYKDMPLTLGYYTREDLPFYYALADAFTVCDQHFCSSLTGTTANRHFFWTGKIREYPGAKANVRNSDVYYNREASWKTFPERLEEQGVSWKVYQNELSLETGLSGEDESWLANFTDNNLEWFSQYRVRYSIGHYRFLAKRAAELPEEIAALEKELENAFQNQAQQVRKELKQKQEQLAKYREELAIWSPENFDRLPEFDRNIHNKAFTTNAGDPYYRQTEVLTYDDNGTERQTRVPKGDVLYRFREDVRKGALPAVSWLVAPQKFSDHPSVPWYGAWYVSEVLDILTGNPEVWKKTIFILTYDENDGYFDHIPPFIPPRPGDAGSGTVSAGIDGRDEYVTLADELERNRPPREDVRESPVGLGYRVPMVVASPWSRGGWVNSQVFDHTSTLQFLETFLARKTGKAIRETNISTWRRAVCGDLTSVFRPYLGERIALPLPVDRNSFIEKVHRAGFRELPSGYRQLTREEITQLRENPGVSPLLPRQEPGIRPACALPYELYANGRLSGDGRSFTIRFRAGTTVFGRRSAGSPFAVYAPGLYRQENRKAWSYAVAAGEQLEAAWTLEDFEDNAYHLCVYGPNGFFREFTGNADDPPVAVECNYLHSGKGLNGKLEVKLRNLDPGAAHTFRLTDHAYHNPDQTIRLGKAGSDAGLAELEVDTAGSHGWYDFTIQATGSRELAQRYAGRVETGTAGYTDPHMGRQR